MAQCFPITPAPRTGALSEVEVRDLGAEAAAHITAVAAELAPVFERAWFARHDSQVAYENARVRVVTASPAERADLLRIVEQRRGEAHAARQAFERVRAEAARRVAGRFPEAEDLLEALRAEARADRLELTPTAEADYAQGNHAPLAHFFGARCAVAHWQQALAPRQAELRASMNAFQRLHDAYVRLGHITGRHPEGLDP